MNKISIALFSIIAMAGVASAQQAKGSASAGATVNAGGTVKAGTGAATGAAGTATGAAKTGAGAATGAAGTATGAATGQAKAGATVAAEVKMEMPKPPAEIKTMLKMAGPRNNCTGSGLGPDMKTEVKFKGTVTRKADLDGWWVHETMIGTMGEGKAKATLKMEAYMTFDAKLGKWRTVTVMNDGTQMVGTAEFKDGKMEGVSDTKGAMGDAMFRDHGDMTDKKAGMKVWGEMSMDKGKTWTKVYDMTCK